MNRESLVHGDAETIERRSLVIPRRVSSPLALTFGRVHRCNQQDPRGPREQDGSDYCHTRQVSQVSSHERSPRLTRDSREISHRAHRVENPRDPESRCRLTCRAEYSRSNTTRMRPGVHVPVSFVSLLVTGTIAISRISSFYPIATGSPAEDAGPAVRAPCKILSSLSSALRHQRRG